MPTQIVELDLQSAATKMIRVRDDVQAALVLVTDNERPVGLVRLPRPANGVLSPDDIRRTGQIAERVQIVSTDSKRAIQPVSIVVPTHERPDDLARCLESLSRLGDATCELIVVDSGPTTNRTAAVTSRFGVCHVVEPLPGLNRARNAGVAAARFDIVAFVDDDVVVSQTWLAAIRACFADPAVGCATGLVLPLELETEAQEEFEVYSQHRRDLQRHVYSRNSLRSSAAGLVGMGANMAFRRDLLLTLGEFDLRFGPVACTRAGDETDMFARILDAGWLIVYTPDAYVWHRHRRHCARGAIVRIRLRCWRVQHADQTTPRATRSRSASHGGPVVDRSGRESGTGKNAQASRATMGHGAGRNCWCHVRAILFRI